MSQTKTKEEIFAEGIRMTEQMKKEDIEDRRRRKIEKRERKKELRKKNENEGISEWEYASWINENISSTKYSWRSSIISAAEFAYPIIKNNLKERNKFLRTLTTILNAIEEKGGDK